MPHKKKREGDKTGEENEGHARAGEGPSSSWQGRTRAETSWYHRGYTQHESGAPPWRIKQEERRERQKHQWQYHDGQWKTVAD
eukprot:15128469-Alexandrium_andersonii.AAC.1